MRDFPDVPHGLRVAHLIESDGPGGAERVVVHMATTLQAAGVGNVVFVPAHGEGWLERQLQGSAVAVEHFSLDRPLSPACARSLAAAFRRHSITIAHSHEFSLAIYGSVASWLAGVNHVTTMHGNRYYAGRRRRRLAMRLAIALSGRTVAVSDTLADHISKDLGVARARIGTIANGVSFTPGERPTLRRELGLEPDDRLLVAVGNLYPVKGHRYLIDALAILAARYPRLHLAISGRGHLAGALTAQAIARGIGDRVHLLGLRSDIPSVLAAGDIFVMPSLSEALPLSLLEAMFARLPIVATDVGDVSVALDGGAAGVLVEPANAPALAIAIARLLEDPSGASVVAQRALERARAEYDVRQMVQRYLAAYSALVPTRQSRIPSLSGPHRSLPETF